MKRTLILIIPLIVFLALLSSCAGKDDGVQTTTGDESGAPPADVTPGEFSNDLCEAVEDEVLPVFCKGSGGEKDKKAPGKATTGGEGGETPPTEPVYEEVRFVTPQNSEITAGLLNSEYEGGVFKAKGGSGTYKWEIIEGELPEEKLPEGLTLTGIEDLDNTVQIKGTPKAVGDFKIKLKVSDSAAAEETAKTNSERTFKLKITENLALNVFRKTGTGENGDSTQWQRITGGEEGEKGMVFNDINLEPNQILKIEAKSNSEKDKEWEIEGVKVDCGEDPEEGEAANYWCSAQTEKLEIFVVNRNHRSTAYLKPKAGFSQKTLANDIEIKVEDEFGSEGKLTIKSLTFQEDPCPSELKVDNLNKEITFTLGKEMSASQNFLFNASGCSGGPYSWVQTSAPGEDDAQPFVVEMTEAGQSDGGEPGAGNDGKEFSGPIKVSIPEGTRVTDLADRTLVYKYKITDTKNTDKTIEVTLTVNIKVDEKIELDAANVLQNLVFSANDTDDSTCLDVIIYKNSNTPPITLWNNSLCLGAYEDDDKQDVRNGGLPHFKAGMMNIRDDSFVTFWALDPDWKAGWFFEGALDIDIYGYYLRAGKWCAHASGSHSYESADEGTIYYKTDCHSCGSGKKELIWNTCHYDE